MGTTRRGNGTSKLLRRSPLHELEEMRDRLDRILDTLPWGETLSETGGLVRWMPRTRVLETDDAYVVRAEIPGVRREDMTVSVDEEHLVIRGRREADGRRRLMHRLSRGTFYRHFHLPPDVRRDEISAELRDGVLTVRMPRTESRPEVRRIEVRSP